MELRPTAERFSYGKVIAGKVNYITRVPMSAGTYKEGQLIQTTNGTTYALATAVALANAYFVCAGDMTLAEAGEVVVYAGGYFDKKIVTKQTEGTDVALSDNDVEILKTKDIFIVDVASQDFAYDEMETE